MNTTQNTTEKKATRGRPAGKGNKPTTIRVPLSILTTNNTPNHLVPVDRTYLMNMLGIDEAQLEKVALGYQFTLVAPNASVEPVEADNSVDELPEADNEFEPENEPEEPVESIPSVTTEDFELMQLTRRMPESDD